MEIRGGNTNANSKVGGDVSLVVGRGSSTVEDDGGSGGFFSIAGGRVARPAEV